jgi:heat shock protein HtpX
MSHIRNYDIRLMTVVAALIGSVLLLSDWARRSMFYGRGRKRSSKSSGQLGALLFVLWLIGIILAPLITQMMAMAVSRKREYLADASGAEMTRNPMGLASALKKIDGAAEPTAAIKRGAAHLCIADPLGRSVNTKEGFFAEVFGTHPPIEKRIIALQAMAYQSPATPAASESRS